MLTLMIKKSLPFFLLITVIAAHAQTDIMVLEKRGHTIITYSAGMSITIETVYHQWIDGTITALRNDSVFVDGSPFHYKEIGGLRVDRKTFHNRGVGVFMMTAGAGVLALGAVNGLYRGDKANTWYTPTSYITAGTLLVVGYLLTIKPKNTYQLGKKYSLEYVKLDFNKKQ